MQNKKRNAEEYPSYEVYPEIKFVQGLEGEELLGLGMIYNFTGKNTTSFLLGKNVNGVTKAFNMNGNTFGVRKLTRSGVAHILDSLINKGWLQCGTTYTEKAEYHGKVVTKQLTPVTISDMGMTQIKLAIHSMSSPKKTNSLF